MIFGAVLLDAVSSLPHVAWEGIVYRHMFGTNPPEKENQLGARWNPAEVPAIYCSVEKETAIAEGNFQIAVQPFRPKAERRLHEIDVKLTSVVQLTDWELLEKLGIGRQTYESIEPPRCKEVGGAISYLGHDGLLVPSARCHGTNLIIYPCADLVFRPLDYSVIR